MVFRRNIRKVCGATIVPNTDAMPSGTTCIYCSTAVDPAFSRHMFSLRIIHAKTFLHPLPPPPICTMEHLAVYNCKQQLTCARLGYSES
jgi:hypothetical protein